MIELFCKNTGTVKSFPEGTALVDAAPEFGFDKPFEILSAKVNNIAEGLRFRLYNNRDVEFLDYHSYSGRMVYCRSLCFLLSKSSADVLPGSSITIRRPISKGYYCILSKTDGSAASEDDVRMISSRMSELVAADKPFVRHDVRTETALKVFAGQEDKEKLIRTQDSLYIQYHSLEDTNDFYCGALVPSTGYLKVWELSLYKGGLLLRVPDRHDPQHLAPFREQPKTFDVFSEDLKWNSIMGLATAGDVNTACAEGRASELIQVSEALQEKKIVSIAEEIDRRYREGNVRLVLITGPTSSGKSTFCKRLSVQLMACGLRPISFSTDDYFVNRLDTPRLPDGSFDFDNFDTVDHDALEKDVLKLLDGETVSVPEYNFVTGIREYNDKTLTLAPGSILLIEGIHALNPMLTSHIPAEAKFKIFINTITSISLDNHNCIPTSDNRLLRRIVRDFNKGAFTAVETISNWPNVRRSEVKWIYPYQEDADVLFNSSYLVEFAVLRLSAEQILSTVPKNCAEYSEAFRLMKFLSYFNPVSDKEVPPTSLLRGFIGR